MSEVYNMDKFIENCYNNCSGKNGNCAYYKQELMVHFDKTKGCSVHYTIQHDIQKIKEGKKNITYPVLEDILKKEVKK